MKSRKILHHSIKSNGVRIAVQEYAPTDNNSSARTLVLAHGLSMDSHVWGRQLNDPVFASLRILAIDLPGHGASSWSEQPLLDYALPSLAERINEVVAKLFINSYVLVGISLGANLALQSVHRLSGCKGVAAIVVPFRKPLRFDNFRDPAFLLDKIYKEKVEPGDAARYFELLVKPGSEVPFILGEAFAKSDPKTRSAILAKVGAGDYEDESIQIGLAPFPVALILGNEDRIYHTEVITTDLYPDSWRGRVQWIPDAGHLPQWDNPVAFNQLLLEFIHDCIP